MTVPVEIIAGPLTLFLAPVGTAFPLVTAAPAAPWVKIGGSGDKSYGDDGVTVTHTQKLETARPAGSTRPVKAFRTEEDLMLNLTLWDATLEQVTLALAGLAPVTVAAGAGTPGTKQIGLARGKTVTAYALLARGPSPYGEAFAQQFQVPVCVQSGSPKTVWVKGKPAGVELEFMALDHAGAASDSLGFGSIVSQHAAPLP